MRLQDPLRLKLVNSKVAISGGTYGRHQGPRIVKLTHLMEVRENDREKMTMVQTRMMSVLYHLPNESAPANQKVYYSLLVHFTRTIQVLFGTVRVPDQGGSPFQD